MSKYAYCVCAIACFRAGMQHADIVFNAWPVMSLKVLMSAVLSLCYVFGALSAVNAFLNGLEA